MPKQTNTTKFWNITSIDDDTGEIDLYGDVVSSKPRNWWTGEALEGEFISPEGFKEDLEAVADKKNIVLKINSCGGDVYSGIAIHNIIKGLSANITVVIEGIAASAASIIAMAGDTIKMHEGSIMMIHGVSTLLWDYMNIQDLKKLENSMEAIEKAIANIYHAKTGIDVDELRNMMKDETWMTGDEAVEMKFADSMIEEDEKEEDDENPFTNMTAMMTADHKHIFVNGVQHSTAGMMNIPSWIPVLKKSVKQQAEAKTVDNKSKEPKKVQEGADKMDKKQFMNEYPELYAEIVKEAKDSATQDVQNKINEAVNAERTRINEIDEIADQIPDQAMVNEAKYGEDGKRMNASQLSFAALKAAKNNGAQFLNNLNQGFKNSGAEDVEPEPSDSDEKTDEEAVNEFMQFYNGVNSKSK